jgi:hypothetical protein
MTTDNNYNEETDSDSEDLTDDQIKSEAIAESENLFDDDYYETLERNNTYYITVPYKIENNYLKDLHISSRGFFNHSSQTIKNYIREYTISSAIPDNSSLEIVKTSYIQLPGGFTLYNIIIKTFWLKIVQRRWRNVLKKRMQMIYRILKNREYGITQDFPKLRGCLADIKNRGTRRS